MTPTWKKKALAMRAGEPDMPYAEIARKVGVTPSAVWKLLNPEQTAERRKVDNARRRAAKRAWEKAHDHSPEGRGYCTICGGLMGVAAAERGSTICRECVHRRHEERCQRIAELWLDGATLRQIAREIGTTSRTIGTELAKMRAKGWELPRRGPRGLKLTPVVSAAQTDSPLHGTQGKDQR